MAGYKVWTRERLTSADLQALIQDQVVLGFASASARNAAITAPVEGMLSYLADTGVLEQRIGGVWRTPGALGEWAYSAATASSSVVTTNVRTRQTGSYNVGANLLPGRIYRASFRGALISDTTTIQGEITLSVALRSATPVVGDTVVAGGYHTPMGVGTAFAGSPAVDGEFAVAAAGDYQLNTWIRRSAGASGGVQLTMGPQGRCTLTIEDVGPNVTRTDKQTLNASVLPTI